MFNKHAEAPASAPPADTSPKPGVKSAFDVLGPLRSGLCDGEAEPSATSLGLWGGSTASQEQEEQDVKGLCTSVPGPAVSPVEED